MQLYALLASNLEANARFYYIRFDHLSEKVAHTSMWASCAALCTSSIKSGDKCNVYYISGAQCIFGYLTDLSKIKQVNTNGKVEVRYVVAQNLALEANVNPINMTTSSLFNDEGTLAGWYFEFSRILNL